MFIAVSDLLVAGQGRILSVARRGFFGRELARGPATFVYPDFEPHEEVAPLLAASGVRMRNQRPASRIRPLLDFWIDAPLTAAANDLEAVLYVAGIFGGLAASPDTLITDRRMIKACNRSFLSFGLGSDACTYLYFDHADDRGAVRAPPRVRRHRGRDVRPHPRRPRVLLRAASPGRPDRPLRPRSSRAPGRRWFFIAGLGPAATIGAVWYLAQKWRHLARTIPPGSQRPQPSQ